jgi:hypothetical protein
MVVWGGVVSVGGLANTGGQYDPGGDSWIPTSTDFAPPARTRHTAVWSGTRMIVWGGEGPAGILDAGGQWVPLSVFRKN